MLYSLVKDFAGPVATVIAASAAAYFARQQWKTGEEKVRLDLFDRRFAIYEELRTTADQSRRGRQDALMDFKIAASRSQFLFGPEVTSFLEAARHDLDEGMVQWHSPNEAAELLLARTNRLDAFYGQLDALVAPYMKHHQRLP